MKLLKWMMIPASLCFLAATSCGNDNAIICGDGVVDAGEACDDGNAVDNDACNNNCELPVVVNPKCGDGVVDNSEACDDGNAVNGDGCEIDCTVTVAPVCGDGVVQNGEACDDGNVVNGDGCEIDCTITLAVCGNGVVDNGEACDDGNAVNGDGCESNCTLTPPVCGDGVVQNGEACDDGNILDGDGCDHSCIIETETVKPGKSPNTAIVDDSYNGTIDSMNCETLQVDASKFDTVIDVSLDLLMIHDTVGDLVVKVVSPKGTVVTVLSRPGFIEPLDNDTDNPAGFTANLAESHTISFNNQGATSAENLGLNLSNNQVVCKDDMLCTYAPSAGAAQPNGNFSLFTGESGTGDWKVCVADADPTGADGTWVRVALGVTKEFSF